MSAGKRARLSLDLDAETRERFAAVLARSNATSLTDLVRKSVALFAITTDHTASGGSLVLRHKDGSEERIVLL